jgi:hypothetical protein
MSQDVSHGVYSQLSNIINKNWIYTTETDGFRITPTFEFAQHANFRQQLLLLMWDVSSRIAYTDYVCIEATNDNGYLMRTKSADGAEFYIAYSSTPK